MGNGMGNIITLALGLITARTPNIEKIAPEAPIAVEGDSRRKRILPSRPPQK